MNILFLILMALLPLNKERVQDDFSDEINIPCFVYHRFGDDRYPSTNTSIDDFEAHLKYLKANDFKVVTMGEAIQVIEGKARNADKMIVLTIDDAYLSFYENAIPLLKKYNFRATLFVSTEVIGASDYMNWIQLEEIFRAGIEIGNHSHAHAYFVEKSIEVFENDLKHSQDLFFKRLRIKPEIYSYPYGEFTTEMKNAVQELGFKAAGAQNSGVLSALNDVFSIPRFPVSGIYASPRQFENKCDMKALPVRENSQTKKVLSKNKIPDLELHLLNSESINTNSLQCFIDGEKELDLRYKQQTEIIKISTSKVPKFRRTLCTVTAQSSVDPTIWHWYSFVWIKPSE